MKKEINYLSLPDYFNKFLLINFNQKINLKNNIKLQFKLSNNNHLGSALKTLNLLEIIFPRKAVVLKIQIKKKKKIYFGQKSSSSIFYIFNTTLSSLEFIEFYRFFSKSPFSFIKNKTNDLFVINRKFKQFEFNKNIFLVSKNPSSSFFFFKLYHLN